MFETINETLPAIGIASIMAVAGVEGSLIYRWINHRRATDNKIASTT